MTSTAIHIPTLFTERLTLRAPVRDDFPAYAGLMASPHAKYIGGPMEMPAAWEAFAADVVGWMFDGFGYWTVCENQTDAFIGMVGLSHPPYYPERELGWMILDAKQGNGFAAEAAIAVREHAYTTLGWSPMVSYIDRDNARSIRLAERLGCRLETGAPAPDPEDLVYRHPPLEAAA